MKLKTTCYGWQRLRIEINCKYNIDKKNPQPPQKKTKKKKKQKKKTKKNTKTHSD